MTTNIMICLAKSRKLGGSCVAGKRIDRGHVGEWVRPVSRSRSQGLRQWHMRCEDRSQIELLDILKVPLLQKSPHAYQHENWLLDTRTPWQRLGRASWTVLLQAADNPDSHFWMACGSSRYGRADKIPETATAQLGGSLRLVYVRKLRLLVREERKYATPIKKRKVRAEFEYEGSRYLLQVTDPVIENYCLRRRTPLYELETAMLCISVGELFKGHAYRLVAGVITPRRCEIR